MANDSKGPHRYLLRQVGSAIRRHRKQGGLTQEALAEHAGLSTYFVGTVERGQAALSLRSLADIAEALDVPLGDLFLDAHEQDRDALRRALEGRLRRASDEELRILLDVMAAMQRHAK